MTNITLTPDLLRWARERAGLTEADLAKKLGTQTERVHQWERSGSLRPAQAEKISQATHTPLGYLYLDAPPKERLPVPDFRTIGDKELERPSPDLLEIIDIALRRQDWLREHLATGGEDVVPFVGSLYPGASVEKAAERIRKTMRLDAGSRSAARTWEEALQQEVERFEECGVLVMRTGIVGNNTHRLLDVDEFRGFALSDSHAPLVFINAQDAKAAQMFTLMHELVHIWLGLSGVSNLQDTYAPNREHERYCNEVAAEALVPSAELREVWPAARRRPEPVAAMTRHFKVSSLVILRRLHDLRFMGWDEFRRRYHEQVKRFQDLKNRQNGGGDFYRNQKTRMSRRFCSALIESTLEGRTTYRDALRLMGIVRVDTFHNLARELGFGV